MILTPQQRAATLDRLHDFRSALADLPDPGGDVLRRAERDRFVSMASDLEGQVGLHDALVAGDASRIVTGGTDATGSILAQVRLVRGLDRGRVATRLGVAVEQYAAWEDDGFQEAPLHVLVSLASLLQVKLDVMVRSFTMAADPF